MIGAEVGAPIAFGPARSLGQDVLRRMFGSRMDAGLPGSQTALTATVLASRRMPFLSFETISHAPGPSRLQAWRFAFAALAGIVPPSLLLAHLGGGGAADRALGGPAVLPARLGLHVNPSSKMRTLVSLGAAAAMSLSSVSVMTNALRPRRIDL